VATAEESKRGKREIDNRSAKLGEARREEERKEKKRERERERNR